MRASVAIFWVIPLSGPPGSDLVRPGGIRRVGLKTDESLLDICLACFSRHVVLDIVTARILLRFFCRKEVVRLARNVWYHSGTLFLCASGQALLVC